jgi:HK97 family phage major capsid protein
MRTLAALPISDPNESAQLILWAACLARGAKGGRPAALQIAKARKASTAVCDLIERAAVGLTAADSDTAALAAARGVTVNFIPLLRNQSVFYRILGDSLFVRVPLQTRIAAATGNASAFVVNEGAVSPLGGLTLDQAVVLEPLKAVGLVVLSDALLAAAGTAGEAFLSRELRRAVAGVVDEKFLDVISGDLMPLESSGSDADAAVADIRSLLAAVEPKAESKLLFVMSPNVCRGASCLFSDGFVFPQMSPTGGSMLGIPAMACDALAPGTAVLLDGSGIAGESDFITVETSKDTTIQMRNDASSDGENQTISLWQSNLVGILARVFFGCRRLRDNAVAVMSGVEWGGSETTV